MRWISSFQAVLFEEAVGHGAAQGDTRATWPTV